MMTEQQTSTKQDILEFLLKQGQATAHDLATPLEISPQAIRRHLKDLQAEGLIVYQSVSSGNGRPQHIYHLSPKGRDRFPNQYDRFAISFLDTLVENLGYEQASKMLQHHWHKKSIDYREKLGNGLLMERVAKLVELRRQEGYMADYHAVDEQNDKFILTEHNCAISQVAASFPAVCGHELEMFAAALKDCQVERTHWIVDGEHQCGYLISITN
ncbi:iron-sulfur cluster biosynthesis transcriptional regulator SufR [Chamaesiphon sp. VAR_48_metabat_135_sub]|uniref:iron-sulfur cluster biosynthesis transcriptional regulator SufR n=1 Tax=Chamaesiphon sp. VAR_48_metabat_135_sub TaxID=2964699 RepID=UPI00286CF7C0|nr:iron-sulfur cluster biosynthesis transcriptional regulator SufR [Chamaesiphon sp. VAR_48_metabat_135_sub]